MLRDFGKGYWPGNYSICLSGVRPFRRLQLVGVTAMFVAAKFEEIDPPRATDFVYITDNTYSKARGRA